MDFSAVTAEGSSRKIPNSVFFEILAKSCVVTFGSTAEIQNALKRLQLPEEIARIQCEAVREEFGQLPFILAWAVARLPELGLPEDKESKMREYLTDLYAR